jgi:hypothetical protein
MFVTRERAYCGASRSLIGRMANQKLGSIRAQVDKVQSLRSNHATTIGFLVVASLGHNRF